MGLGLLYCLIKMQLSLPQPGEWYPVSLPVGIFCLYPSPGCYMGRPGCGLQSCPAGEWTYLAQFLLGGKIPDRIFTPSLRPENLTLLKLIKLGCLSPLALLSQCY